MYRGQERTISGCLKGAMTHLSFSLAPTALVQLHDALTCLAKFNESVSLEAEYDLVCSMVSTRKRKYWIADILNVWFKLRLSALNSTKTAYSAFVLEADSFFENYSFSPSRDTSSASSSNRRPYRFCCKIFLRVRSSLKHHRPNRPLMRNRHSSQYSKDEPTRKTKTRPLSAAKSRYAKTRSRQNAGSLFEWSVDLVWHSIYHVLCWRADQMYRRYQIVQAYLWTRQCSTCDIWSFKNDKSMDYWA